LGEVCDIKHGYAFPGDSFSDDLSFPVLVTPGNFRIGGGFQTAKPKTFTGPLPEGYTLTAGDLIVTMTDLSKAGDTLGYPAIVPDDRIYLHNQRVGRVVITRPDLADKSYIHWVLRTRDYRAHVLGSATGSTVRHTSPTRLLDFNFDLPSLNEQRRVASVLEVLTDLIVVNQKLMGDLEDLGAAVFAKLGFDTPGNEHLDQYLEVNPKYPKPKGVAPYVDMASLSETSSSIDRVQERLATGGARFANGDTLLARITPCLENGKTAFVDCLEPDAIGVGSTEFIVLRTKDSLSKAWPYFLARSSRFRDHVVRHMTGTSGRQRCPSDAVSGYTLAALDPGALEDFAILIEPVMQAIRNLALEVHELERTRQELLPLLLSGRVTVAQVAA
jgi:type I restriction enzyme S subunit